MCPKSVSVIICSYQLARWDFLMRAVESVETQTLPPKQIIVVIDGNEELASRVKEELSNRCVIVPRALNGGLSEARNSGIAAVDTPFVGFLDDDAEADPRWLEELVSNLDDPTILGAGGKSLPIWEDDKPEWFPDELLWAVGCSYLGLPSGTERVRNVYGGCAVYRTDLFTELGGFRSEFGRQDRGAAGCEETEFCLRVTHAHPDSAFIYVPTAIIRHHVPSARSKIGYLIRRSFDEGRSKARISRYVPSKSIKDNFIPELDFVRKVAGSGVGSRVSQAVKGDVKRIWSLGVLISSVLTAATGFLYELAVGPRPGKDAPT